MPVNLKISNTVITLLLLCRRLVFFGRDVNQDLKKSPKYSTLPAKLRFPNADSADAIYLILSEEGKE